MKAEIKTRRLGGMWSLILFVFLFWALIQILDAIVEDKLIISCLAAAIALFLLLLAKPRQLVMI